MRKYFPKLQQLSILQILVRLLSSQLFSRYLSIPIPLYNFHQLLWYQSDVTVQCAELLATEFPSTDFLNMVGKTQ